MHSSNGSNQNEQLSQMPPTHADVVLDEYMGRWGAGVLD